MAKSALFSLLVDHFSFCFLFLGGSVYSAHRLPLFGLEAAVSAHLWRLGSFWRTSFDVLQSGVALEDNESVAFPWCSPVKGLVDDTTPC